MELTPVEHYSDICIKRDDLFTVAGVYGGKARTCWHLSQNSKQGLVTAGSRLSPQIKLVALIAKELGLPCRAHCPTGELGETLQSAKDAGCEIIQHKAGYNSVIIARAREDAKALGWTNIPFGMECAGAVNQTRIQVKNLRGRGIQRIVMPVGSGMSAIGVLWGLRDYGLKIPVLGVVVGASPEKRFEAYAPFMWQYDITFINAGMDYHKEAPQLDFHGISLDPIYEAKCIPFVQAGDLLWVVGHR